MIKPDRIIVATDADDKGDRAAVAIAEELSSLVPVLRFRPPDGQKDIGEIFKIDGRAALSGRLDVATPMPVPLTSDEVVALADEPDQEQPTPLLKTAGRNIGAGTRFVIRSVSDLIRFLILAGAATWLVRRIWPTGDYGVLAAEEKLGELLTIS